MYLFVIAFLLGDISVQHLAKLPRLDGVFLILIFIFLLLFIIKKIRNTFGYFLLFYLLGVFWTIWFAQNILVWQLPKSLEKETVLIRGYIASIPISNHHQNSFIFSLKTIQHANTVLISNALIKLSIHQNNNVNNQS